MNCPRCLRSYTTPHRYCPFDGEALTRRSIGDILQQHGAAREGVFGRRYVARERIGAGAMTQVFVAEDLATGETVALKVLDAKLAGDKALRDRFLREAAASSRFKHPNAARTLAHGETDEGVPYLVLELVPGEPLGRLLKRHPLLHPTVTLRLMRQVAMALEAAHEAGVVHRDLKPDNIVLQGADGAPTWAKLVDFGLARLVDSKGPTPIGTAVGTVEYMAPEQVVSDPVDARTDVYGLSMVLYRLLSGHLPFEAHGVGLLARQLSVSPPPPSHHAPGLDHRFDLVCLRGLRKRPDNRYPNMRELRFDLERLLGEREGALYAHEHPAGDEPYVPSAGYPSDAAAFLLKVLPR